MQTKVGHTSTFVKEVENDDSVGCRHGLPWPLQSDAGANLDSVYGQGASEPVRAYKEMSIRPPLFLSTDALGPQHTLLQVYFLFHLLPENVIQFYCSYYYSYCDCTHSYD